MPLQFYIFKPAVDTHETGSIFPQVQQMSPGYNYKGANSVHALSRQVEKFPDETPDLDYFIVHSRSKLTDLLSAGVVYGGFLISNKFKELIEKFNLPLHQFYSARVLYKKHFHQYYWLHVICNLTDYVDYSRSKFFVYSDYNKNIGYIDISSKDELIKKEQNLMSLNPNKAIAIWAEQIFLNGEFDTKLDLFKIGTFDADYYVSEKLRHAILQNEISGCAITPANNLVIS